MPDPVDYEQKLYLFKDALETLQDGNASANEKNKLLKACIERIVYTKERPQRLKRKPGEKKGTYTVGGHWTSPPIEIDVQLRV